MAIITKGDPVEIPVTLKKNGNTFVISGDAVIKAVLTKIDRATIISTEVTVNKSATGTDLAKSLIIVEFTEEQSAAITYIGDVYLEIQVADPKKKTWTTKVLIRNGNIA